MFKFDFDLAEEELDEEVVAQTTAGASADSAKTDDQAPQEPLQSFAEHSLSEILKALPNIISYSPLRIPSLSPGSQGFVLAKRDLYDARFQLIAAGHSNEPGGNSDADDLQFVEAPSDLVPGVYEGGLKTWECSIDLAGHLAGLASSSVSAATRLRVLELGCGTAVPTLALLYEIFSAPAQPSRKIDVHLQDYNELVFRLVTLPNVILAWYMSPASQPFRSSQPSLDPTTQPDPEQEQEPYPPADPTEAGDLQLTPALVEAFTASLKEHGVTLRFFSGSWETFDVKTTLDGSGGKYDIVLTSETIYRTDSLGPLVDLMWQACTGSNDVRKEQETSVDKLASAASGLSLETRQPLCLVAAKLVYFGVGGGVAEFTRAVENGVPSSKQRSRGRVETVWEREGGVRRVLLRVRWE